MKRITYFLITVLCILICACSFTPPLPESGLWYCEELKITLEFGEKVSGKWHITETEWINLKTHLGYGGEIILYYLDEQENEVEICNGIYRYKKDTFFIDLFSRLSTDSAHRDYIDVQDETVIFYRIEEDTDVTQ